MKKFVRLAVTLSLLLGVLGVGAIPVSADNNEVCTISVTSVHLLGLGGLHGTTDKGLFLVGVGDSREIEGSVPGVTCNGIAAGVFAKVTSNLIGLNANGFAGGWCGHSVGTVTVTTGGTGGHAHTGTWLSAGTQLIFGTGAGDLTGSVNAVVDSTHHNPLGVGGPVHQNSCTNGSALAFLVNGAVVLTS